MRSDKGRDDTNLNAALFRLRYQTFKPLTLVKFPSKMNIHFAGSMISTPGKLLSILDLDYRHERALQEKTSNLREDACLDHAMDVEYNHKFCQRHLADMILLAENLNGVNSPTHPRHLIT